MLISTFVTALSGLAASMSTSAGQWKPVSTYTPFVRSGATPSITHPPYTRTDAPVLTTRVTTIVETVGSEPTTMATGPAKPKGSEYYATTVAYGTYGVITVSGTPPAPPSFKESLSLTYHPAAATSNRTAPATPTSTNPLANLDPNRPTKGLVFAIQRYADANCDQPIGPRFAYDGSQDNSCFFSHGSCRGSCGYLSQDTPSSPEVWKHAKQQLSAKKLEQHDFASWNYRLVSWDDVWNKNNKWKPAYGHMRHKHKKWMFPESNNEGTAVCDAVFWEQRDCRDNSPRPESGQVMRWQPRNLREDEGRCMNGFKNGRGVPAMAASFRIRCYA